MFDNKGVSTIQFHMTKKCFLLETQSFNHTVILNDQPLCKIAGVLQFPDNNFVMSYPLEYGPGNRA
jgi:hypothetical protein